MKRIGVVCALFGCGGTDAAPEALDAAPGTESGARDSGDRDTAPADTGSEGHDDDSGADSGNATITQYWLSDTGGYTQVSASYYHRCAVRGDGGLVCWGSALFGKMAVPEGAYLAVSVARTSTCALGVDGVVVCSGCEEDGREYAFQIDGGQCRAPSELAAAIAVSDLFGLGLAVDGSLLYWSTSPIASTFGTAAGEVGGGLLAVDAAGTFFCAILLDEDVACWSRPELDIEPNHARGPYDRLTAGGALVCAARPDDGWVCWAAAGWEDAVLDGRAYIVADVGTGYAGTCGILVSTGEIACFGEMAVHIPPEGVYTDISVADVYACAVRDDGVVACWGDLTQVEQPGSGD